MMGGLSLLLTKIVYVHRIIMILDRGYLYQIGKHFVYSQTKPKISNIIYELLGIFPYFQSTIIFYFYSS